MHICITIYEQETIYEPYNNQIIQLSPILKLVNTPTTFRVDKGTKSTKLNSYLINIERFSTPVF